MPSCCRIVGEKKIDITRVMNNDEPASAAGGDDEEIKVDELNEA